VVALFIDLFPITEDQMDKAAVLENIQKEHANLESILAPLSDEQICEATLEGKRSVKDILAHITAWERLCTGWLACALRGETPAPETLNLGATEEDVDRFNEQTFLENKDRSLPDVLADSRASYQQFLEKVQALSEEDLTEPHKFSWAEGRSLVPFIAANSYDHYQEHAEQIRKWLRDETLQA
jgi:hypothetical protein